MNGNTFHRIKKKMMSLVLTLCMVVTVLPTVTMPVYAEGANDGILSESIDFENALLAPLPNDYSFAYSGNFTVMGYISSYDDDDESKNVITLYGVSFPTSGYSNQLDVSVSSNADNIVVDKVMLHVAQYKDYSGKTLEIEDDLSSLSDGVAGYDSWTLSYSDENLIATPSDDYELALFLDNSNEIVFDAITVYYHYQYSITYNCGDGGAFNEGYTAPSSYTKGVGVTLPTADNITKTGYAFDGWYEKSDFSGSAVTAVQPTDSGAKTYYAKWVQKSNQTITVSDSKVQAPANEAGLGISASTSGDGSISYAIKSGSPTDVVDVNASTGALTVKNTGSTVVTVTAAETKRYFSAATDVSVIITPAMYTVSFDANGHGTAPSTQTLMDGHKVSKPDDLSADGYIFNGWYSDAACTDAWNFSSDTVTRNMTLYAGWTKSRTTTTISDVKYDSATGTYSAQTSGIGQVTTYYKVGNAWQSTKPTTAGTYSVGVTVAENSDYTALGTSSSPVTNGKTYTVEEITYTNTLKYDANGGTGAPAEQKLTVTYPKTSASFTVSSVIPVKSGYTFAGWYTSAEGGSKYSSGASIKVGESGMSADQSTTLYAHWTKDSGNSGDKTPATSFTDVPSNAYYAAAVDWAVSKNITTGTGNNQFSPDNSCPREQVVTFLWRAYGSPEPSSTECSFTDVTPGKYYYKAVLWAAEKGITRGVNSTTFGTGRIVTRKDFVTFLYRAEGSPAVTGTVSFNDVNPNAYYANAVTWAASKGVTTGIGNNNFGPDNPCKRAQVVTFLYRALK